MSEITTTATPGRSRGRRPRRVLRSLLGLAGALLCMVAVAAPASARPQGALSSTPQERAAAIATPSVVYLGIKWTGYLQLPGGSPWIGPVDAEATCTGFVANPTGYIVTAGHCVDNNSATNGGKEDIVQTAVDTWLAKGLINQARADAYRSEVDQFAVEGYQQNSLPAREVTVYQTVAASGAAGQRGTLAEVKDFSPFSQDDVALLKVESPTPMPALELAPQAPAIGSNVIAMGYPGSVTDSTDPSADPSVETGTISGQRTVGGVPFTQISAPISQGMSGGPSVDSAGQAVGTTSFSPTGETQPFNFITSLSSVREMLARNGVSTALSPTDKAYRQGLSLYFAGHYHAAVKAFNQVLQAEPSNVMAQQYRSKAVQLYPQEVQVPKSGFPVLLIALIVAGAMVVAAAIGSYFWRRSRTSGSDQPVASTSTRSSTP